MSQDSSSKAGAEPVAVTRSEGGRFAAGAPSANPKGRPKRGQTLAEQWRRATNWEAIRARLEGIVLDPKAKHADIVAAARELADRSHGKPTASHEISVSHGAELEGRDLSAMPIDERRELLEKLRSLPRLTEGSEQGTE